MAGLGYNNAVVVYNQTGGRVGSSLTWYGVRMDRVRVEYHEAVSVSAQGRRAENACMAKIYDADLPLPYVAPVQWHAAESKGDVLTFESGKTFFVIVDKDDIAASLTAPEGEILDNAYTGGLIAWLSTHYGRVYEVNTVDHYSLLPHWQLGGK